MRAHPNDVLKGAQAGAFLLPAVDHYCGVESRIRKAIQLQIGWIERNGVCSFDVTLDCEDGAPVGQEAQHAAMVVDLLAQAPDQVHGVRPRLAVRVHPVDDPAFAGDVRAIVGAVAERLTHVMLPKVESLSDVERAVAVVDAALQAAPAGQACPPLMLHALIESPAAVEQAFAIASHPRVQSLSFGLMDFVSAHGGALPASCMGLPGQFTHPMVVRAKLAIAAACHASGKVPSHCVVTEFQNTVALRLAAQQAAREMGYTRMWSIHPDQIEPILQAFAPDAQEVEKAAHIVQAAVQADWAPIRHEGVLHDRASYRYYWQVLQRAHASGQSLPDCARLFF